MTVNFNKITFEDVEGNKQVGEVAKELGNLMYMRGENIEECELGKEIYIDGKAGQDTELTDGQAKIVKKYIGGYPYVIRKAILDSLK